MANFSIEKLSNTVFFVEDCLVDALRGTITVDGLAHPVEPKVMEVLLYLVANNNKVVGQEVLFSHVWPNSVFSPGSIRRCIAILRKILKSERSTVELIKTFPKKGYGLHAKIKLQATKNYHLKHLGTWSAIVIIFLGISANIFKLNSADANFEIGEAYPLTSSNEQEFNAKVSPDGLKVAYLRINGSSAGKRSLWVKELTSEKTFQLIADDVREFDWSPSNNALAYTSTSTSTSTSTEYINTINLETKSITRSVIAFEDEKRISSLHWGTSGKMYALTKQNHLISLSSLDTKTGKKHIVKSFNQSYIPYEVNLHRLQDKIVLAGFDNKGYTQIKTLKLGDTNDNLQDLISLDKNRYFLSWHPSGHSVLVSDGRRLSLINQDKNIIRLNVDSYDFVQHPQFLPDGNGIIISFAKIDADIAQVSFTDSLAPIKLVNSNTVDREASLSPDKTKLAYISHRKGFPQVYLLNVGTNQTDLVYENKEKLLGVSRPVWHANSKKFGFSNYDFPIIVSISQSGYSINYFEKPLGVLADFYSNENQLLTFSVKDNQVKTIDITTQEVKSIGGFSNAKPVLDPDDKMIFTQGSKIISVENHLDNILLDVQDPIIRYVKSGTELLIITENNHSRQLIAFDLKSKTIRAKYSLPDYVNVVSAVHADKLIYESANIQKDIILLKRATD
ncbi:winged helix-turn-helix domain-containing protein [Colwelliaceae bacterium 6471]